MLAIKVKWQLFNKSKALCSPFFCISGVIFINIVCSKFW